VTVVVDTAPVVAMADAGEPQRAALLALLQAEPGSLAIPAPATAEIDYLLGRRFGDPARRAFLSDLAAGRFSVACLELGDYARIAELEARYADLSLGLVDCALIVLADRLGTTRIVTFDERHFRAVTTLGGDPFTVLPADT
jgi:predicted nucleic acid-binding protein